MDKTFLLSVSQTAALTLFFSNPFFGFAFEVWCPFWYGPISSRSSSLSCYLILKHARNAFTETYSSHLLSWWVLGGSPDRQLYNQMLHKSFTIKSFPASHLIIIKLKNEGYGSVFLSMWKVIWSNQLWLRRFWEVLSSKSPSPLQMRNSLNQVISFKFIVISLFFMPILPNPWSAS